MDNITLFTLTFPQFCKNHTGFHQKIIQQMKTYAHKNGQSVIFVDKTWRIVEKLLLYRGLLLSILRYSTIKSAFVVLLLCSL